MEENGSLEIGPIDMLMGLVISKEIDPWNIDIVELTNKYMERIRKLQELDLRLSGKTILVASILLRMQSEDIFREKSDEKEEEEEEELDFELKPILPPLRRVSGKITLPQLMEALLQALEEADRKKTLKPRKRREEKHVIRIDEHRLNIEEQVTKLYDRICEMIREREFITMDELLDDHTPLSIARTLLFILYLETKSKIELEQEELFGEIYIRT
ncbi:MAG TPA: ScpA family protein [Candidatus Methanofastidiosa archaeon]|nr:ScpA family protein [Candidatus Methanofastidiosa archaeon]